MADTKTSALSAITTPAGTDEYPTNQGGVSGKTTLAQINAYCEPLVTAATSASASGFATDTYVTGSGITIPTSRIQAKTLYRCTIEVSKTAASIATPVFTLRYGTAGSTADTALGSFTSTAAQTAAADDGMLEVWGLFYSVGSGTSAVVRSSFRFTHDKSTTGFGNKAIMFGTAVSSGFNSSAAGSIMGVSMNGGSASVWTVNMAVTELINLL